METSTYPTVDSQAHPELSITLTDSTRGSMLAPDLGFQRVTRAAISSNNVASMAFMEAVLQNYVFLHNFAAPEILTFKLVCKSWKAWFVHNAATTMGHARRQDDTRDWYFPLFGKLKKFQGIPQLAGMWHNNAQHSSTSKLSNFASILKLGIENLLESAGGLFVFKTAFSLVVTNPLTKLSKELPACDGSSIPQFSHCKAQQLLMVDEVTNTYKFLLFWCTRSKLAQSKLVVYDSSSNKWGKVLHIQPSVQPLLGSWSNPPVHEFKRIYSALCTRGRLYVADVRAGTNLETSMDPQLDGVLRLFEVDIVRGQGKLCNEFPMCKVRATHLRHPLLADIPFEVSSIHRNLELVECMGHLYAVIPAGLDEYFYPRMYRPEYVHGSEYMPLQFHIIKLEGDVGAHGVLRIEAVNTNMGLRDITIKKRITVGDHFFSCMAKGSVIWVTIDNYLLQYDVLSRKCFTEVMDIPQGKEIFGLVYRASFHMKP